MIIFFVLSIMLYLSGLIMHDAYKFTKCDRDGKVNLIGTICIYSSQIIIYCLACFLLVVYYGS